MAALCIYLVWLIFSIAMWNTRWMTDNKAVTGVSLVFAAVIYLLLCSMRSLPQLHITRQGLSQGQSLAVVRLRLWLLASLKLIFVCGFSGMSISLLFSQLLRVILAILFMLLLLCILALFFVKYRVIVLQKPADMAK